MNKIDRWGKAKTKTNWLIFFLLYSQHSVQDCSVTRCVGVFPTINSPADSLELDVLKCNTNLSLSMWR